MGQWHMPVSKILLPWPLIDSHLLPVFVFNSNSRSIEGYCNPDIDPYRHVVRNPKLLDIFKNYWNEHRTTSRRDVAHFFTGTDFSADSVIGLAYPDTACRLDLAYGLNWMTFTTDLNTQSVLYAHELDLITAIAILAI
jgi:hypothetical protein